MPPEQLLVQLLRRQKEREKSVEVKKDVWQEYILCLTEKKVLFPSGRKKRQNVK